MIEQTLVLIKPDGVKKAIAGKIISRFEDTGLKIAALKMVWPDHKLAEKHYPLEEEWAKGTYEKAKTAAEKTNTEFKHKNHMEYGKFIQDSLKEFITESPVIAMVLEGPHAIEIVRKIVGPTEPRQAPPGTIRGDFISIESYAIADTGKRAVRNLIHASDSKINAEKEIKIWFSKGEIHKYQKHDPKTVW